MSRFLTVVLAALACAFAYLLATGIALPEAASVRAMFVVSSVALLLAAAAIVLALATTARVRSQGIAVQNLARSVDAAFADFAARKPGVGAAPRSEIAEPSSVTSDEAALIQREADRRPIEIVPRLQEAAAPVEKQRHDLAEKPALARVPAGESGLRLRPLLAIGGNRVAGFDVLADEKSEPGARRKRTGPETGKAAMERSLIFGAIDVSGRPDFSGDRTPLHVAVTQALLADREEFATVVEALKRLNGTARSIVLSLPTELMENPAQHSAALAKLAAARSRLAADGWPSSAAGVERLWRSGVSFLRLPAARLLSRDGGPNPIGAASLVQMLAASGMTVIATEAGNAANAADLAKLGVTLMSEAAPAARAQPRGENGRGDAIHI